MQVYIDGRLVPREQATISVFDHGFLYGDGVFEGIRVYDGTIFRLEAHLQRLYESARTLSLRIPLVYEELKRATVETVAVNGLRNAYIRLVVSRGKGDLGIDPDHCAKATVVIIVDKITLYPPEVYEKGIELITASTRRIPVQCLDPRIKSLNYINNILAKIEAKRVGLREAVMLNVEGKIAECTADNLFIVKRGVVSTPDLLQGALGGITRAIVLEIAREEGFETRETVLALHDVYNADECFLTGTGAEIVPVIALDGRTIGSGTPGRITQNLLARYRELRVRDGEKVLYSSEAAPVDR